MLIAAELRRILIECDIPGLLRLWANLFPAYPQPMSKEAALRTLHLARTKAESVPMNLRRWSHIWLTERNLPSLLPDKDHPPKKVSAVGIGVRSTYPEVAKAIHGAMENAVEDAYAEGQTDPEFVGARMREARARERKALGLRPLSDN